jgi:dihydrofolate reductase
MGRMSKLLVRAFSISLDGYGAGPDQSLDNPLGLGGMGLHEWMLGTKTFFKMVLGAPDDTGRAGVDDEFAARSFENVGAWIMGRNMFGPIRGPWPDDAWKGWWGANPPYHVPVFVLTHHARAPLTMEGGTTFYFVTDGIHAALQQAQEAAKGKDIRIGGGASVIRQYLAAGLIDELHLAVSPVLLGKGEHLLSGIDTLQLGYTVAEHTRSERATHVVLKKG